MHASAYVLSSCFKLQGVLATQLRNDDTWVKNASRGSGWLDGCGTLGRFCLHGPLNTEALQCQGQNSSGNEDSRLFFTFAFPIGNWTLLTQRFLTVLLGALIGYFRIRGMENQTLHQDIHEMTSSCQACFHHKYLYGLQC